MKIYYFFILFLLFSFKIKAQDTVKVSGNLSASQVAEQDYNNGIEALKRNDFEGAITLFNNSLASNPSFDKALANRAVAYSQLKNYSLALLDINRAITLNAYNPEFYFNKSLIFFSQQLKDSQTVALDNCLKINPGHAEACYYKGMMHFEFKEFEKAIEYYTKAINSKANYVYAYNDRGSVKRAKGDYSGAIADYEKALSFDNSQFFILNNLGSAYRLNKNYSKAIETYSKSLQKKPSYLIALSNRGAAHFENNNLKAAQEDFEAVLKQDPKNAYAYNNLASIAIKNKDYKKAKEMASRSIEFDQKNGPAFYNRGIARQMLREEDGSCSDWKKASDLGVNDAKLFINANCLD